MASKIDKLKQKYGITDEDLKKYGLVRTPVLSGRILEKEKKAFVKVSQIKNSNQSNELRKELEFYLSNKDKINWTELKIIKAEGIRGQNTSPVRVKVSAELEKNVTKLCKANKVTVSSFIRYIIILYLRKNEGLL